MRRREFISLLGGAAVGWPLAARAQQPAMPLVGFLHSGAQDTWAPMVGAFRRGLSESGYAEGRNIAIEYRWAKGQYDQLPAMAADLVRRNATVVAALGPPAALAAKAATSTVPIVFVSGSDPVRAGLVASFNQPGGNVTGVYVLLTGLEGKRLGLLRDLVPQASLIGMLINPRSPDAEAQSRALQGAARAVGQEVLVVEASNDGEVDAAFAALKERRAGALVVAADVFFTARRERIVALAARYAIPTIYELREFVVVGGLMSYGTSLVDGYYRGGLYVSRILGGAKASDLPIVQSAKFELAINLKTAKALGLEVAPGLSAIADEVIE
jgi:putative tryptophan/tyrosine transport system substrate-binding protein